jgi:hypothetical protein
MNCRRCQGECGKVHVLCDEFLCEECFRKFESKKAVMQEELLNWAQKFITGDDQLPAVEDTPEEPNEFSI